MSAGATGRRLSGVGGLFSSGGGVALLSLVVAAAIGLSAGLMLWHDRQVAYDDHLHHMNGMGIVLVEQTSRYVQVIDSILQEVQNRVSLSTIATSTDFQDRFGQEDAQSYLAERASRVPQVDALFLINANGIIFNWSRQGPVSQIDSSARDYFQYFKANADPGLYVGSVYKAAVTGEESLHFARRLTGPNGTFLGLVLANVRSQYLNDFYRAAATGSGQSIALLRNDGTMLTRYPNPDLALDMKLPLGSAWYQRVSEGSGNYDNVLKTDGIPSVVTVHPLPDYPLVIDVLMDRAVVFAQWQREAVCISAFALVATLSFAGLFWTLGRQFRRLSEFTERLAEGQDVLVFMASHDALTKLPNRILFKERIEQAIVLAERGVQFAVLCLDLDRFKQINDTMGHLVGDELLVAVADRLQACVREGDTVARLGGDEFAIIQLAIQRSDDADVLAQRILRAFSKPFDIGGEQVMSGVSIGVSVAPGDILLYETLMRSADIALYTAKTEGRGTACFFESKMDERIRTRHLLERELERALERGEFELNYQPQVSLATNKVTGFEALLRWNHADRGSVSPMIFIPLVEETGMIVSIGEWVLRTACLEACDWPPGISVAVNLSPVQFTRGDLVATVRSALEASGLRPERLELEVTESAFLGASEGTLRTLNELRATGVSVALDDFGTGYSSLSYLRSFPFNKIKIDQSFVRDLMTSKESLSIVRAVTGLGESLGMATIAEGVETQEQLDKLRQEGCTEVQGYFFSRPRPAKEIPAILARLGTRTPVRLEI